MIKQMQKKKKKKKGIEKEISKGVWSVGFKPWKEIKRNVWFF